MASHKSHFSPIRPIDRQPNAHREKILRYPLQILSARMGMLPVFHPTEQPRDQISSLVTKQRRLHCFHRDSNPAPFFALVISIESVRLPSRWSSSQKDRPIPSYLIHTRCDLHP